MYYGSLGIGMRTYLECIPCFFKQAIEASKFAGANEKTVRALLAELSENVRNLSMAECPPQMGKVVYGLVRKYTGKVDPFLKVKMESNRHILDMYDKLKKKVLGSQDRLFAAVELAIAGNIIDYGVGIDLDVSKEVDRILRLEKKAVKNESKRLFNYGKFKNLLKKSRHLLYIGDNSGEIVFDKILIEEIKRIYPDKTVTYAIKAKPIINDALLEDAYQCGIDKIAHVISSGLDIPGTVLKFCSKEFLGVYKKADMVISKGQGNFESLSDSKKDIFYLFMVKCPVVARHMNCAIGSVVLYYNKDTRRPF